ncbi:MAG: hypothetical protein ACOYKD_00980 [Anaerolineaceae bacterium]|jgi:hypothetical protein
MSFVCPQFYEETDRNRLIIEAGKAFTRNDLKKFGTYLSEDITFEFIGADQVQGIDEVLEMIPHLNLAPVGALNLQGLLSDEHYSSLWGFARTTKNNLFAFSCICTFNPCDSEKVSKLTVFLIKISSTSILFD